MVEFLRCSLEPNSHSGELLLTQTRRPHPCTFHTGTSLRIPYNAHCTSINSIRSPLKATPRPRSDPCDNSTASRRLRPNFPPKSRVSSMERSTESGFKSCKRGIRRGPWSISTRHASALSWPPPFTQLRRMFLVHLIPPAPCSELVFGNLERYAVSTTHCRYRTQFQTHS